MLNRAIHSAGTYHDPSEEGKFYAVVLEQIQPVHQQQQQQQVHQKHQSGDSSVLSTPFGGQKTVMMQD